MLRELALVVLLSTAAWGQCAEPPASGPTMSPGPASSGPRLMNSGPGSDNGRDDVAPRPHFNGPDDVVTYVRETYGKNTVAANDDPYVQSWLQDQSTEDRYVYKDKLSGNHEFSPEKDPYLQREPGTADDGYYCHDFAWQNAHGKVDSHFNPDPILAHPLDNGYVEVTDTSSIEPGDIVIYHQQDPNKAEHSGKVVKVQDGQIYMESKDVGNSLFTHRLDNPNGEPNYFKNAYADGAGGGTRVFRPASPPTTPPAPAPPPAPPTHP